MSNVANQPKGYPAWREMVNAAFLKKFKIDIEMAGIDEARLLYCFESGDGATQFVDWWGEKYGLIEFP